MTASAATSRLQVGAGRAVVHLPDELWPIEGFTGEHDPLCARVLVLDTDRRFAWAVVDLTSLPGDAVDRIRSALVTETGADAGDILVSVSHTFSAPHLAGPPGTSDDVRRRMALVRDSVLDAVRRAAADAVAGLRGATVTAGGAVCRINVNRDIETAEGWTLGVGETGFADHDLHMVAIRDEAGETVAVLLNHAVQPSVMNESDSALGGTAGRLVTADLAGAAARAIEDAHGGVAFFVIGAAGDQAPALTSVRTLAGARKDAGAAGFAVVELLGERLAAAASLALTSATAVDVSAGVEIVAGQIAVPGQEPRAREDIVPLRGGAYGSAPMRELPYWLLRIGDVVVVGVQVELSAVTGVALRAASPFAGTLVATMVNGAAKYLPEAEAFDRFTYEAQSSRYARGAAEALVAAVTADLARLRGGSAQGSAQRARTEGSHRGSHRGAGHD